MSLGLIGVSKEQLALAKEAQFACASLIKQIQDWNASHGGDLDGPTEKLFKNITSTFFFFRFQDSTKYGHIC